MAVKAKRKTSSSPRTYDTQKLMEYAARMLSTRAYSGGELRSKLLRRAESREALEEAMQRLAEIGFIDDQRFADAFASWRRDRDGLGKTRVVRDLMARRIAPQLAREAADNAYQETDESALALKLLERKYRGKNLAELLNFKNPDREKHLAGAFRKLRTAGFGAQVSIQVLRRFSRDADRLEEMADSEPEDCEQNL